MNKVMLKYIFVFILSFLFSFVFFYVFQSIYCDEVWVYGFSYNISKGMIIYRDFNVLQMPLYFFIASLFIKIFGNYLIVNHILNSLLFSTMIVMLFKIINWKVLILLPVFIFFWPSGYNLLCLFFLILIIYLIHKKKDKDWLIAFIIGLCFITKQNMGIFLFVPCFLYSKKKLKSICSFLIPFLILSIYLIYNDAFYQFIDYCFLGMIDFGGENSYYDNRFLILFVINIIILLYWLFKAKWKDKELFYILMFQLLMYPIFDIRHYICSTFAMFYLILKRINKKNILILIGVLIYYLSFILLYMFPPSINLNKDFDYLRNSGDLNLLANKVKEYVGDNNNFFFTDYYNYYIKLYYDIPIGQYDLLLSGNVGYKGMEDKLNELTKLCSVEKCYFFSKTEDLNEEEGILMIQFSDLYFYIRENYKKVDKMFEFDIYTNDIEE